MNVARTPHSMKKGSQVLRNAAQLKDTERRAEGVRVISNARIFMCVLVCVVVGVKHPLMYNSGQERTCCVKYHMGLCLHSQRPTAPTLYPTPPPSANASHPPVFSVLFCPSETRSPAGEVTFCGDTEGGAPLSVMNYRAPILFKRLLRRRSVCAEAAQTVTPALSMWVSRE